MSEQVIILGGATDPRAIGPSCYLLSVHSGKKQKWIMVDCGKDFGSERNDGLPDFAYLKEKNIRVDAVLLTHAHGDHCAGLGALEAQELIQPDAHVWGAPQTLWAGLPRMLDDGLRDDEDGMGGRPEPLYTQYDRDAVMKRCKSVPAPGWVEACDDVFANWIPAGHVPGAASVVIRTDSGNKLITGDMSACGFDYPIVQGPAWPREEWPRDAISDEVLGTDFTYGTVRRRSVAEEVDRLIEETFRALRLGKKVVIPAFGFGKGQNIAAWLSKAGIPVWIDGSIRGLYRDFLRYRWSERDNMLPPLDQGIYCVERGAHREELINSREPMVIITTSGMGNFGPIRRYLDAWISNPMVCFFFTSWLAPGTIGDQLMEMKRTGRGRHIILSDRESGDRAHLVQATIDQFGLSAHADFDETLAFFWDLALFVRKQPFERIVMTHGTFWTKLSAAEKMRLLAQSIVYGERGTRLPLTATKN